MVAFNAVNLATRSSFRTAQQGLQRIVEGLASSPGIALARIWLLQPTDTCEICRSRDESQETKLALHLAASAGQSRQVSEPHVWNRLDGAFHCFPIHTGKHSEQTGKHTEKIGRIGATGEPLLVHHKKGETSLLNTNWLDREGIQSFFGYPVAFDGQILGVFAVFSRTKFVERDLHLIRLVADGAAQLLGDARKLADQQIHIQQLNFENVQLKLAVEAPFEVEPLIAVGPASRKLDDQISMVAAHDRPVLITGERGVGKELVARLIHQRSGGGLFRRIAAQSLTATQFDQLLSPTGTEVGRDPQGVSAIGMDIKETLFLDGIERIPLAEQARLAERMRSFFAAATRTMPSEQSFMKRVIAASRLNLRTEVAEGRFRQDLYCAFSVAEIEVPPLRQRLEDLPALVTHLLDEHCRRDQRDPVELDGTALDRLALYGWPGNVRELAQLLGCALSQLTNGPLRLEQFPHLPLPSAAEDDANAFVRIDALKQQERNNLVACLRRCDWKVYGHGGAAEQLGIKPTTLIYRMKILGIRRPAR